MPDNCPHHHLYLITFVHPGPWISFRICIFLLSLPRLVCSAWSSLALAIIICAYHFSLPLPTPVTHVFYPTFLPFPCLYSSLDLCSPNPVLHPITESPIEPTFSPFPTPPFIPSYMCISGRSSEKNKQKPWKVCLVFSALHHPLYLFCPVGRFLDIPC